MYSMIIVDDEKIIREGLKKYITKYCKNFVVREVFEDGKEALEFLENNSVDLILTDIKMANVSGIEFCEKVRETNPYVQIIILSGYDDFTYAQNSIKFDVLSYHLKPIDNVELLKDLKRAAERIEIIKENNRLKGRSEELAESLRKKFFIDLIFGANNDCSEEEFEKLDIKANFTEVKCCIYKIITSKNYIAQKWRYGKDGIKIMINNYFYAEKEKIIYHFWIDDYTILILHDIDCLNDYTEKLKNWTKETFEAEITIEPEYVCVSISELKGYRLSRQIADDNYVKRKRYALLNTYIRLNMFNDAKLLYAELIDECLTLRQEECIEEIKQMFSFFEDGQTFNWSELYEKNILDVCDIWFDSTLASLKNKYMREADIIKKIKEYIAVNYAKDITLDDIGVMVYMNSVYLSRYFKEQTGQNFRDYLLNVRMVNAEKLIKENKYKIYEISNMVGYKNSRHFAKQFKQFTGYMPKEYGKNVWRVTVCDEE